LYRQANKQAELLQQKRTAATSVFAAFLVVITRSVRTRAADGQKEPEDLNIVRHGAAADG